MRFNVRTIDLRKLDSATKYPSIPTYHALGARGRVTDKVETPFSPGAVLVEEKIDGTNARVIFLPQGDVVIGSRKELLTARGDVIFNDSLGIVEALRGHFFHLDEAEVNEALPIGGTDFGNIVVLYLEVYGGQQLNAWKEYGDGTSQEFRLFDVAVVDPSILRLPIEEISLWRERRGQAFMPHQAVVDVSVAAQCRRVPHLFTIGSDELPTTVTGMADLLESWSTTQAAISGTPGRSEGFVLRTPHRKTIAKAHLHMYRRTLGDEAERQRLADKAAAKEKARAAWEARQAAGQS